MDGFTTFGSHDYCVILVLFLFARGADMLSTRIATPNLVLEGNPISKFLGWRWGIPTNIAMGFGFAFWPAAAIGISTLSVLVASRNFQSAWLMRSMGEERYGEWRAARIRETPIVLFVACLAGHTLLLAALGAVIIYYGIPFLSSPNLITAAAPLSIGVGIVGYAVAVAGFTMLAVWRLRRPRRGKSQALPAGPGILLNGAALKTPLADSCACEPSDFPGK